MSSASRSTMSRAVAAAIAAALLCLVSAAGAEAAVLESPAPGAEREIQTAPPDPPGPAIQVVGGQPAPAGAHPSQVSLTIAQAAFAGSDFQRAFCGGTLVTPLVVVTAAHCLIDTDPDCGPKRVSFAFPAACTPATDPGGDASPFMDPNDLDAIVGRNLLSGSGGTETFAHAIYVASNYTGDETKRNDIGFVSLADPATQATMDIVDSSEGTLWRPGAQTRVAGHGAIFDGGPVSDTLRVATVPVVPDSTCGSLASYGSAFDRVSMICAGVLAGGTDSCHGDSGGPLQSGGGPAGDAPDRDRELRRRVRRPRPAGRLHAHRSEPPLLPGRCRRGGDRELGGHPLRGFARRSSGRPAARMRSFRRSRSAGCGRLAKKRGRARPVRSASGRGRRPRRGRGNLPACCCPNWRCVIALIPLCVLAATSRCWRAPRARSAKGAADEDLQLALYVAYELHYRGFEGVPPEMEWDPSVLAAGHRSRELSRRLCASRPLSAPRWSRVTSVALVELAEADEQPPLSKHLGTRGTRDEFREFAIHRSAYQLKEADPHSWAIPRLVGGAKAALVEIQFDEYGSGRAERMHARMFADSLEALGLDPGYGAYLDEIPGHALATVNLMSMFGLHRRWRGAIVGHLAMFEMTSAEPNRCYANGLAASPLDAAAPFFDEHGRRTPCMRTSRRTTSRAVSPRRSRNSPGTSSSEPNACSRSKGAGRPWCSPRGSGAETRSASGRHT